MVVLVGEEVHSVLKEDLAGGRLPSGLFGANAAWWAITVLAFNLNSAMKQLALGQEWVSRRLKAVRFGVINLTSRTSQGWPVFSGPQTHCRSWSWVNTRPAWTEGALGAFLRRKKAHLGAPKAITATAHKLARLIYTMLRYGQEYVDAGAKYYERQYQQRALRAAKRRAAHLGYQMVPMSDAGDRTTYAPPGAPTAA